MKAFYRLIFTLAAGILIASASSWAQWAPTGGPDGPVINCSAATRTGVFISTQTGFFRTTDGGAGWERMTPHDFIGIVDAIFTRGDTVYVSDEALGMFKS